MATIHNVIIKISLFTFALCTFSSFTTHSQVTIGLNYKPLSSTFFEFMKKNENAGSVKSTKCMMLPRVFLREKNNRFPMQMDSKPNYETMKPVFTGMIVYNVNSNTLYEKGLYLWDGTQWNRMNICSLMSITAKK